MRIEMTMIELDEEQWAYLQANVHAEYEIPEGVTRVCLTLSHGEQERHVEVPMGSVMGLLMGLGMVGVTREMRNALARLRPVDLPEFLDQARRASDPPLHKNNHPSRTGSPAESTARLSFLPSAERVRNMTAKDAADLARLMNTPCEHDSPVVEVSDSQFEDAPPVRKHEDGCQSYGPYTSTEETGEGR